MWKQAWRSYVASLHPRNMKKAHRENNAPWFLIIYWACYFPASIVSTSSEDRVHYGVYIAYFFVKLLPLFFLMWSNTVDKLSMPKAIYLSPMKRKERETYIHSLMIIKIVAPAILAIVLYSIWGCFYRFNLLQMLLVGFLYITIGIGSYVASDLVNKYDRHIVLAVRDKKGEPKDAWSNGFVMVVGILFLIALEVKDLENGWISSNGNIVENILLYGLVLLLLIMDIHIVRTRYIAAVQDRCDYEIAFKIFPEKKKR